LAFVVVSLFLVVNYSRPALATPPGSPSIGATITFANGEVVSLRARDRFRPVAVSPGETVTIAAQFPPQAGNIPAVAQALDGGVITAPLSVAADGTASLSYQAGTPPGRYRLFLSARGRSVILQFEVSNQ